MKVFIAGATGAVGRPLCRQLIERGHEVVGMTRSPDRADELEASGVNAVVADALDPDAVAAALASARPGAVASQLTDLPSEMIDAEQKYPDNDRARLEGTANLLAGARECGARRFIAQSLAFAYHPDGGPRPATENERLYADAPEPFGASARGLVRMESEVCEAEGIAGVVLRYGFFYGPGTWFAPGGSAIGELRKRRLPKVGSGDGLWSMCHVEDAAGACVAAVESDTSGVFNVCDDRPIRSAELIEAIARIAGTPRPLRVPAFLARWIAGEYTVYLMCDVRAASNEGIKRELGWKPSYPEPIEGLERVLAPAP